MKTTPLPCAFSAWTRASSLALLRHAQRRGRLVHDQDPGVPVDRPADRHRPALAAGEGRDRRLQPVDMEVQPRHGRPRRLGHVPAVQHRQQAEQPPLRLAAEEDVGADRQVVGQRQVLVDRLDAAVARVMRRGEGDRARPARRISPSSWRWTPEIALISVDLPAPLSPASASTSPSARSSDTPLSAWTPPKRLDRLRTDSRWLSPSWRPREPALALVDQHRDDDDDAHGHELPERLDIDEHQPVLDHGDHQGAGDGAADRARPAEQAGAADHHRGDRVEQQRLPRLGRAGVEAGGIQRSRQPGADRGQQVQRGWRGGARRCRPAAPLCAVGADGIGVLAEAVCDSRQCIASAGDHR